MRGFSYNNGYKHNTHQRGGKQGLLKGNVTDYGKAKGQLSLAASNYYYPGFGIHRNSPAFSREK